MVNFNKLASWNTLRASIALTFIFMAWARANLSSITILFWRTETQIKSVNAFTFSSMPESFQFYQLLSVQLQPEIIILVN